MSECKHEGCYDCEQGRYICPCGVILEFSPNGEDNPGDWEEVGRVDDKEGHGE